MRKPVCFAKGAYTRLKECVALAAIALVALELAVLYPTAARQSPGEQTWRQKNYQAWYHGHQIFQREPDELSDLDLERLLAYCRCLKLMADDGYKAIHYLTKEECMLISDLLEDTCPNLEQHVGNRRLYEACQERLAIDDHRVDEAGQ